MTSSQPHQSVADQSSAPLLPQLAGPSFQSKGVEQVTALATNEHIQAVLAQRWLRDLQTSVTDFIHRLLPSPLEGPIALDTVSQEVSAIRRRALVLAERTMVVINNFQITPSGTIASDAEVACMSHVFTNTLTPLLTDLLTLTTEVLRTLPPVWDQSNVTNKRRVHSVLPSGFAGDAFNAEVDERTEFFESFSQRLSLSFGTDSQRVPLSLPDCAVYSALLHPCMFGFKIRAAGEAKALAKDTRAVHGLFAALFDSMLNAALTYRSSLIAGVYSDGSLRTTESADRVTAARELTLLLATPPVVVHATTDSRLTIKIPFVAGPTAGATALGETLTRIIKPFQCRLSAVSVNVELLNPRIAHFPATEDLVYEYTVVASVPMDEMRDFITSHRLLGNSTQVHTAWPEPEEGPSLNGMRYLARTGIPRHSSRGTRYGIGFVSDGASLEMGGVSHNTNSQDGLHFHDMLKFSPAMLERLDELVDAIPGVDLVVFSPTNYHVTWRERIAGVPVGSSWRRKEIADCSHVAVALLNSSEVQSEWRGQHRHSLEVARDQLALLYAGAVPVGTGEVSGTLRTPPPTAISMSVASLLDDHGFAALVTLLRKYPLKSCDLVAPPSLLAPFLLALDSFLVLQIGAPNDGETGLQSVAAHVPFALNLGHQPGFSQMFFDGAIQIYQRNTTCPMIADYNSESARFQLQIPRELHLRCIAVAKRIALAVNTVFDNAGELDLELLIEQFRLARIELPDVVKLRVWNACAHRHLSLSSHVVPDDIVPIVEECILSAPGCSVSIVDGGVPDEANLVPEITVRLPRLNTLPGQG